MSPAVFWVNKTPNAFHSYMKNLTAKPKAGEISPGARATESGVRIMLPMGALLEGRRGAGHCQVRFGELLVQLQKMALNISRR